MSSAAPPRNVLKFTQQGQFLMQIGKPGQSKGSNDVENLRLPAKTFIDNLKLFSLLANVGSMTKCSHCGGATSLRHRSRWTGISLIWKAASG